MNKNEMLKNIEANVKAGEAEFFKNLKTSNIMEMSFNKGEIIIVEVICEDERVSNPEDIKYVVKILYVINESNPNSPYHKPGTERWVRIYDLKKVGTFLKGGQ